MRFEVLFVLSCLAVASLLSASLLLSPVSLNRRLQTAHAMLKPAVTAATRSSSLFERLKPRARLRRDVSVPCRGLHAGRDWKAHPVKLLVHEGSTTLRAVAGRIDPEKQIVVPCECACVESTNATDADAIVLLRCGGNFLQQVRCQSVRRRSSGQWSRNCNARFPQ